MSCLINVSEFIKRVYGSKEAGATPPASQTITRKCRNGKLPAELHGAEDGKRGTWYINWDIYQKQTGNDLVDKVLRG
ncbi:hypothetical protein QLH32_05250 [Acinetobacter corruptisaponis]|uniref:Uncharacterized protein n=1 Tax=Acinetobacter corruptisaponis TaxID=3045147 RepID=A0ABY8S832_9GAMM|nr:hypothetical protein [Acinetobacter sp. KCTC 92772]WHP06878.1 hypothetical protein QLH32_05250 [Acinetobacter sp. KCTC 92772]